MSAPDVVIIGGGVAGLSAFAALAPHMRATLLEREPTPAAHASGRNAAIFRPLEAEASTCALAYRSLALLSGLAERPVLDQRGLILASADPSLVDGEAERARALGIVHRVLREAELREGLPSLRGGQVRAGLLMPDAGVLDIHEITRSLERAGRRHGGQLLGSTNVSRIVVERGRVVGVAFHNGDVLPCAHVVLAAGAWVGALGAAAGAPLPLQPVRRHLVQLTHPSPVDAAHTAKAQPVLWRIDRSEQVYFRREGAGVLASPCDETRWVADVPEGEPMTDPQALELLALRFARTAPDFSRLNVQKTWACFRTFAADGELVLGPDPRIDGLHWFCGLGGRGMGVGPAAGEYVASALLGQLSEVDPRFAVERLLSAEGGSASPKIAMRHRK